MNLAEHELYGALMRPGDPPEWNIDDLCSPRPEWQRLGACRNTDPSLFITNRPDLVGAAMAVCAGCPVVGPCRDYAISDPSLEGVWGGLTKSERSQLRRSAA